MRIVTVKLPEAYVEVLDRLVAMGRYTSRSEAIRIAIRDLIAREAEIYAKLLGVRGET